MMRSAFTSAGGVRPATVTARREAVQSAVRLIRERFAEPLTHDDMARAALLSRYHFNRVFRLVTGVSPGRFLTAVRMAEAKRLLLTTEMRVTDVCFAVGFESLGTFTTRFGQFVGLSPQQLRLLSHIHAEAPLTRVADGGEGRRDAVVRGWVTTPPRIDCFTLVGLFPAALPQCLPVSCTALWAPGPFDIGTVRPGIYTLFGLGYPGARSVLDAMLTDPSRLLVRRWPRPIRIDLESHHGAIELRLRPPADVDPPVVLAAPVLSVSTREKNRNPERLCYKSDPPGTAWRQHESPAKGNAPEGRGGLGNKR